MRANRTGTFACKTPRSFVWNFKAEIQLFPAGVYLIFHVFFYYVFELFQVDVPFIQIP